MNTSTREMNVLRKQDSSISSQSTAATTATAATQSTKSSTRRRNRLAVAGGVSNAIEKHELSVEVTFD